MYLIEAYILRRIVVFFIAAFSAAIVLAWTVQLLARINFLTTSGQTFFTVLKFSSLFIPAVLPLVMPFALVIAVAQTLSAMNQDSELVVINAAGSPHRVVWRPVLLLGLGLSLLSFGIANFITPYARLTMRDMTANAHADLLNVFLQEGSFRRLSDKIYLEIGERKADSSIGRLFIVDQRDANLDLYYYAVSAYITEKQNTGDGRAGNYLIMKNGEIERRDNKTGDVSIIRFDSYTFDLSEFAPAGKNVTIYPKDQFLTYLFHPDPDDSYYQKRPLQYTAELHKRLTEWLYPLIFALLALVAAGDARSHREARISASFTAISLSFAFYWLSYFFAGKAETDIAYIPLLYILPLAVTFLLLFMLLTNRSFRLPPKWADFFYKTADLRHKHRTAANKGGR
ncbi:LPS export ABC transporter permease LptF [Candidatus Tokpelaia sp.]|uniref:LPS export ABC transporter permease LptF n=1 Tax=Candidatus Tokpelaia sp. TaxID=2233777 RepID=UPI00123BE801|nr:LPS export ABC transporter permease LptF [Candidatus Tokpelaia sp.]KAA6404814.1 LPS export ABC transporter permease LptF [Candidatus Tokpelaia sp.]